MLRLEGNRALVVGDAINHRVNITIDGPVAGRRRLLAVIRHTYSFAALRVFAARQGMGVFYGRGGSCCSVHVLPSGSLKVTNEPHG